MTIRCDMCGAESHGGRKKVLAPGAPVSEVEPGPASFGTWSVASVDMTMGLPKMLDFCEKCTGIVHDYLLERVAPKPDIYRVYPKCQLCAGYGRGGRFSLNDETCRACDGLGYLTKPEFVIETTQEPKWCHGAEHTLAEDGGSGCKRCMGTGFYFEGQ